MRSSEGQFRPHLFLFTPPTTFSFIEHGGCKPGLPAYKVQSSRIQVLQVCYSSVETNLILITNVVFHRSGSMYVDIFLWSYLCLTSHFKATWGSTPIQQMSPPPSRHFRRVKPRSSCLGWACPTRARLVGPARHGC